MGGLGGFFGATFLTGIGLGFNWSIGVGLGTSTDVLDAQTAFADAQSAEISALAEYQIALVDLAYATGTLLGAAKVQCRPIAPETGVE